MELTENKSPGILSREGVKSNKKLKIIDEKKRSSPVFNDVDVKDDLNENLESLEKLRKMSGDLTRNVVSPKATDSKVKAYQPRLNKNYKRSKSQTAVKQLLVVSEVNEDLENDNIKSFKNSKEGITLHNLNLKILQEGYDLKEEKLKKMKKELNKNKPMMDVVQENADENDNTEKLNDIQSSEVHKSKLGFIDNFEDKKLKNNQQLNALRSHYLDYRITNPDSIILEENEEEVPKYQYRKHMSAKNVYLMSHKHSLTHIPDFYDKYEDEKIDKKKHHEELDDDIDNVEIINEEKIEEDKEEELEKLYDKIGNYEMTDKTDNIDIVSPHLHHLNKGVSIKRVLSVDTENKIVEQELETETETEDR